LHKILEIEHLKKSFGNIEAVKDVSFYVKEGEILGIIGPNGAGKTTIFNLIMGDHKQDNGDIILLGKNIGNLKIHQRVCMGLARTYQFVRTFQSIMMLSEKFTFKEHIDHEERAKRIARITGLETVLYNLPGELNIELLRKLELAMAYALKPKILLVDEMFAGLTREESNEIISIVRKMMESGYPTTVLVVDHNLSALKNIANRVIAIDLGLKIAEGSFKDVCSNDLVRKAYLGDYIV
jgi:ABC-type branched-subunit amino acid transport system ATPase component